MTIPMFESQIRTNAKEETRPMIKAVLLDLDNTLVLFDETAFYLRYMERIAPFFEGLVPAAEFRDRLLLAIRELRHNDGRITNRDFFLNLFCQGLEEHRQMIWRRYLEFYQSEYEKIPVQTAKPDGLEPLLDQLAAWGLNLVVATNPIFPEIAQEKRLSWVGLQRKRFCLLTHIDNMRYVKPRPEYYQQICALIGSAPHECLMVGNDAVNDMVAGTVGVKTFLSTEAGIIDYSAVTKGRNVRGGQKHPPDFSGPLLEVRSVVAKLNQY
jgi:FMN phosphatase YigB (HAD superfamily)